MKRIPKVFRETMTLRDLKRRILRYMHTPLHEEFVRDLYQLPLNSPIPKGLTRRNPGAAVTRKNELTAADIKRMKQLARDIRANRGLFNPIKLGILLFFIVGSAVFGLFFQDRLIQNSLEVALTRVVGAPAVFDGFRVQLFNTGIWFDRLQIADPEDLSRNAVDLHGAAVDLDTNLLLRRVIHIRSFGLEQLELGSNRSASTERDAELIRMLNEAEATTAAASTEDPLMDTLSQWLVLDGQELFTGITGAASLEMLALQELEATATPSFVVEEVERARIVAQRQEQGIATIRAEVSNLEEDVQGLVVDAEDRRRALEALISRIEAGVEPARLPQLTEEVREETQAAARFLEEITTTWTTTEGTYRSAAEQAQELASFIQATGAVPATVQQYLRDDRALLESRARELTAQTLSDPIQSLVMPVLSQESQKYLALYQQVRHIIATLAAPLESGVPRSAPTPRGGRIVALERQDHPQFHLTRGFFSYHGESVIGGELNNITTEPRRIAGIPEARLFFEQPTESLNAHATFSPANGGTNTEVDLVFTTNEATIPLGRGIVPASSVTGTMSTQLSVSVSSGGAVALQAQLSLRDQTFPRTGSNAAVGNRLMNALESLEQIDIQARGSAEGFALESNIAAVLIAEAGAIAQEQFAELVQFLEAELMKQLEPFQAELQQQREILNAYLQEAEEAVEQVWTLREELTDLENLQTRLTRELQQQLEEAGRQGVRNIPIPDIPIPTPELPAQIPDIPIPTPTLPRLPGRR